MIGTTASSLDDLGRSLAERILSLRRLDGPVFVQVQPELEDELRAQWPVLFACLLEEQLAACDIEASAADALRDVLTPRDELLCATSLWRACFRSNTHEVESWNRLAKRLLGAGPAQPFGRALAAETPETLSRDLTVAYHAAAAALLPRYRQEQLAGRFELGGCLFTPGPYADYGAMGPQCFFGIALRLLVQRWLAERRMPLPVALWHCFEVLDADWCFAAGRLVLGARAPVVVAISARTRLEQCAGMLFALDWSGPDAPLFVVSRTATGAQVRRAKLGSA